MDEVRNRMDGEVVIWSHQKCKIQHKKLQPILQGMKKKKNRKHIGSPSPYNTNNDVDKIMSGYKEGSTPTTGGDTLMQTTGPSILGA